MKKILFDGIATQGTVDTMFHGGSEYAKFILRNAIKNGYVFDVVLNRRMITGNSVLELIENYDQCTVYYVDNIAELYHLIDSCDYNVFYSALPYNYNDYNCKAEFIGVIHGLRSLELPWDRYRYKYCVKWYLSIVFKCVNHLKIARKYLFNRHLNSTKSILNIPNSSFITVSNHSKYSIRTFFPTLENTDIKVFYSPFEVIQRVSNLTKTYFLIVSANRFEKNVCRAIEVFDKLFTDNELEGFSVIVTGCGKQPFLKKIVNYKRFELKPYVSNEDMERLYSEAFCFVYPSLNEGFGYPPLKAMGYGVPVIASSATSIPEVCENAALYFVPTSKEELYNRILQIVYRSDLRKELVDLGLQRVDTLVKRQAVEISDELSWIFDR